jgi:hypothetical protein
VLDLTAEMTPSPETEPVCERPYELTTSVDGVQDSVLSSTGVFQGCPADGEGICLTSCANLPVRVFAPGELTSGSMQFAMPADPNTVIVITPRLPVAPPR